MTYSLSPPYLGNLMPALPSPFFSVGLVWGCGWLGPPLFFVLAKARLGAGAGAALTNDKSHLRYVLSSMFPGPFSLHLILTQHKQ
jgi:hypothetical protein